MTLQAWLVFAGFWVLFVTSPGPNAANCILTGMTHGFRRALWGVLGILSQAALFLGLSAAGVTALIAASPTAFLVGKLAGAALLVWLGLRNWRRAARPLGEADVAQGEAARAIWLRAFLVATINPKSVAGYLAAFSQFVMEDVPIAQQMIVIVPTALTITFLSYATYTGLGAWLGRRALSALANVAIRRLLAGCFIFYGLALGASAIPTLL
ncbi:threonine/homoserine/homoserine lactone efflux protein [Sagittula marina]|uniref:Threonine/homoserine/homoserine lactone efflux protein n=1 Tax=Sagittula marina TaxID=943940 RepID=A0A7W6GRI7_9RHOB|nr:LysE family transporter [Sagittula marina]MBB3984752.1 threonine/homoserine/homoserine lactone efflux protein [Sagittula marina]